MATRIFAADDLVHPEDRAALAQLRSIPLFTECLQAFMKLVPERLMHGVNMAQKVRLGPQQLPEIYAYLSGPCAALGIAEPEFYLEMNPRPNAYTYGDQQAFLTITSGLVDDLAPQEVQTVVAHECGHIACRHTLYHTMAALLAMLGARVFGPLALVSLPVQLALLYWARRSELSADRASALVMGGAAPVVDAMARLAGGPKSITDQINRELWAQQAEEYDKLMESQWDELLQGLAVMDRSHPFLAVRTREITQWCASAEFKDLLAGAHAAAEDACPSCGRPLGAGWKFCRHCGAAVQRGNG